MVADIFNVGVRENEGVIFLDLRGEINSSAEQVLESVFSQASESNPSEIVLNFCEVSYINSTGIALIVSLLSLARKSNINLFLYGLSQHYQEIFRITRLSDFIQIHPDEASVLAAVVN